jgi:hypothetical protein
MGVSKYQPSKSTDVLPFASATGESQRLNIDTLPKEFRVC